MNRPQWILAVLMLVLAVLLQSKATAQGVLTTTALAQPLPQASNAGTVCPLSDAQNGKAQATFALMAPTFLQEPRCVNCHGLVNPFAPNTTHMGGRYDLAYTSDGKLDTQTVVNTLCADCHNEPWIIPDQHDFFTNKDTVTLCKHLKAVGDGFLPHMEQDHFAGVGFEGTRGLNGDGQAYYEAQSGKPFKPEPPRNITRPAFIKQGHDWVDAMGGKFKGDDECGCVPHHYAILVEERSILDFSVGPIQNHSEATTQVQIPLTIQDDASFTGQAQQVMQYKGTATGPRGMTCTTEWSKPVTWKLSGKIEDENKVLHVRTDWTTPETNGTLRCSVAGIAVPPQTFEIPALDSHSFANPLSPLDLPSTVGETNTYEVPVPNGKSTVKITITKLD